MNDEEKKKELDWKNTPGGALGWLLWSLSGWPHEWVRKLIIFFLFVLFGIATGIGAYQLFTIRVMEIKKSLKSERIQYWKRSKEPEWKVALLNIWSDPDDIPEEIWHKAINEEDIEILIAIAAHPWVPLKYKEKLIETSGNVRIRLAGILNTQNRENVVEKLSEDTDKDIRLTVARNKNIPVEVLKKLAKDRYVSVRASAAANSKASIELLKILAGDPDLYVRMETARNSNINNETLKKLAKDKNESVRAAVVSNPTVSPELLNELLKDESDLVKEAAAKKLKIPEKKAKEKSAKEMKEQESATVRQDIFDTKQKENELQEISEREELAKNSSTPADKLAELSRDVEKSVRQEVAKNHSTPLKYLKRLAVDKKKEVRLMALFEIISRPERQWSQ